MDKPKSVQSVEAMLNDGLQEHVVALNEAVIVNSNAELPQWEVSLGRLDVEHVVFTYFDNKAQNSMRFTRAGKYTVNLGSHRSGGQETAMMHALTVIVQ
jgi:hypothetical protein